MEGGLNPGDIVGFPGTTLFVLPMRLWKVHSHELVGLANQYSTMACAQGPSK